MNRRSLFKALAAIVPLSLASRVSAVTTRITSKQYGYVAVGVQDAQGRFLFNPGDCRVWINGKSYDHPDRHIQRANDREGWFEYLERHTMREWALIEGRDPYADFDAQQISSSLGITVSQLSREEIDRILDLPETRMVHVKADVRLEYISR